MKKEDHEVRREQWLRIVSECNNSGLSKKAWCLENGINVRAIYYWQRKFRDEAISSADASNKEGGSVAALQPAGSGLPADAPIIFADLTDKLCQRQMDGGYAADPPSTAPVPFPGIVVDFKGSRVYVGENAQPRILQTVLEVLRHA